MLPWANTFHCGNEGRHKAGGRLSTMPGHGRPPNAHPHSSWGHQGTLHVVSPVFSTLHHSVFNPHGDSLVPSPFSLNPYHLLSQSSFQVTVLLSRHWENRVVRREFSSHAFAITASPCLCLCLYLLPSLLLGRPHCDLSSASPAGAFDPLPSCLPRCCSSNSSFSFLSSFLTS